MRLREPRGMRVLPIIISLAVAGIMTIVGTLALCGIALLQSLREFFKDTL